MFWLWYRLNREYPNRIDVLYSKNHGSITQDLAQRDPFGQRLFFNPFSPMDQARKKCRDFCLLLRGEVWHEQGLWRPMMTYAPSRNSVLVFALERVTTPRSLSMRA